jgi:hypothetical protein
MQRFKSFSSQSCDDDLARFERMVNDWLESAKPRILHMAQSALGAHLILSFIYEDPHARVAVAERETAVPHIFEHDLQDTDLDPADVPLPDVELPY